tara:strand:+ start:359 stop:2443 length:2085 start_codon:yes stop_codon:yes gene_type:complete
MALSKAQEELVEQIKELKKQFADTSVADEFIETFIDLERKITALSGSAADGGKELDALTKQLNDMASSASLALNSTEQFDRALKNNIKTLTGVTDASDTLIGSLFKLKSEGKSNTEVFEQAKETFNETFSALNVGTSIVRKVTEASLLLSVQMEKQTAAFNAQTGAGGKYNAQLRQGEAANREFGISLQEIAESRSNLMDGLSGYGVMQAEEQMRLTELTAQYGKLGVSTSDFTGVLETSARVLGQTTQETEFAIEETRLLAQGLGISLPKALNDLNAALPQLAFFGDEATEIFKNLQIQSQETGLAVGELIGIAEGFDTFDEAASAAGNLNAVLNTQMFDTMGLLEAQLEGPDAFGNLLREQLQGAVGDFDSLDVFQKKAIANAAGLNQEQLASIMNAESGVREVTGLQTDFNDALAAGRSLFDELAILGKQVMISLQGPMEVIGGIISTVNSILGKVPDIIKSSVALVGGTMLAVGAAKKLMMGAPGTSFLNPLYVRDVMSSGPSLPGGKGGGPGMFSPSRMGATKGARMMSGLKIGGSLAAIGAIGEIASGGDKTEAVGAGIGGAGGAALGSLLGPLGTMAGGYIGSKLGRAFGGLFENGGGIAGTGPVPITAHGGEVVVPVEKTPAASNLANMVAERSSVNNKELIKEIRNLNNRPIQVSSTIEMDNREFGRSVNKHFGAPGSKPANSAV